MVKKNETCKFTLNIIICFTIALFFILIFMPVRESLSLLHGSELISPLATEIAIDKEHARDAYLQTLGPDIKYAAYYSTDYY